ncbi:hypothetical protein [Microvirga pudoricolor]|uniref:hypothetical protein n=1 Tax=Microvirga pudoricolor TaxID=2778729 RepID=UPI00194E7A1E|nr:hypothetical protein [Microvirga pudoricolor]MBM6593028.1 hypothetical protein [Microvirga pudoricolor]
MTSHATDSAVAGWSEHSNKEGSLRGPLQPQALPFDPQRRAASSELKTATGRLVDHLEARERDLGLRRRARKDTDRISFRLALECLFCNLATVLMVGGDRALAVPRSSAVMWSTSRYHSPVYGQHFLDALGLMAHPGVHLIDNGRRGFKLKGGVAQRSTVFPARELAEWLPPGGLRWDDFTRVEDHEVIVLKGKKTAKTDIAEAIEYEDTPLTRRRRKQVQQINAYLRSAPIIIVPDAGQFGETKDGLPVDPARRTVRRIFNNGSWLQGGRLYDAFWETMKREDRGRLLRIGTPLCPEGERIANVDYGQLFMTLAYLEANLLPPEGDLYDITGNGSHREGWKRLSNALLLSATPLRNWPMGLSSDFPPGTKLKAAIATIKERHGSIAHLFGTGLGFKLMLLESEMLIEALLRLYAKGITALPLHDSVLVASSEAGVAEEVMAEAFSQLTGGVRAKLKTTFS